MIKLPPDGGWKQPNSSDRAGSVAYSKNLNFDEAGCFKLSPRTVVVADEATNGDFGVPLAIGRYASGDYQVATSSNANFDVSTSNTALTVTENSGSNEPTLTQDSHAVWFKGSWHATSDTGVFYRPSSGGGGQAWTSASISLTSGKRHFMEVFASRQSLCITNGNTVVQYTESGGSYTQSVTLTLPSDYEAIGLAYNNGKMAVLTRLGTSTASQNQESRFFIWDGAKTGNSGDPGIGADSGVVVIPYKSSYAVLTRNGNWLYYNGGGFEDLGAFPFYYQDKQWGGLLTNITLGSSAVVDGDIIYSNVGLALNTFGRKQEKVLTESPSGVWCLDPKVGLYHRWSPSISKAYVNAVTDANVNTTTNVMTITSGTIPSTGNIARLTSSTNGIGGLTLYHDYYIIKTGSTTFKLAETKEYANIGIAIDLTSVGSGGSNSFWMYDLLDYGNSYSEQANSGAGAIALTGVTTPVFQDVIFGGDYADTSLNNNDSLCVAVPFLENRGYLVTPKIFSTEKTDVAQKLIVKYRPLKSTDSIVVKYRGRDMVGLPISSPELFATWTGVDSFYTTQDLSEAKNYLDAGGALECEFIAGAGGNQMSQVLSIDEDAGTYAVVLEDEVIGAAAGRKSHFVIQNWEVKRTITSADPGNVVSVLLGEKSKFCQLKIELRGSDVAVEEMNFINTVNEQAQ